MWDTPQFPSWGTLESVAAEATTGSFHTNAKERSWNV